MEINANNRIIKYLGTKANTKLTTKSPGSSKPKEKMTFEDLQREIDLSLKELERKHFSEKREAQLTKERVRLLNSKPSLN